MNTFNPNDTWLAMRETSKPGYWSSIQNQIKDTDKEFQMNNDLQMLRSGKAKKIKSNTTT